MINPIKLTFLGDISLNDDYSLAAKKGINPFVNINEFLNQSDLVIGNLEAVSKGDQGENYAKPTRLNAGFENLTLLKYLHLDIVTLANNHVYDQLLDGFVKTITYLNQEHIAYLGAKLKNEIEKPYYIVSIKDKKIGFINYVHANTNPMFPEDCGIVVNVYNQEQILFEINRLKPLVDFVVLLLHWGLDNSRFPEPWQRKDAKAFSNAGADLIVGHHSHVLQGYEKFGKSFVFYNLGNFAFSRLVINGRLCELDEKRQCESVILHAFFSDDYTVFNFNPVRLNGLEVCPIKSGKIKWLSSLIPFMSNIYIWPAYKLYLTLVYKIYFYLFGNRRNPFRQLTRIDNKKLLRVKQLFNRS